MDDNMINLESMNFELIKQAKMEQRSSEKFLPHEFNNLTS